MNTEKIHINTDSICFGCAGPLDIKTSGVLTMLYGKRSYFLCGPCISKAWHIKRYWLTRRRGWRRHSVGRDYTRDE